jgi:hypothetical protein
MPNVEPYTCGTSCEPDPDQTQETTQKNQNDRYSCGIAPIGPLQAFQVMYT